LTQIYICILQYLLHAKAFNLYGLNSQRQPWQPLLKPSIERSPYERRQWRHSAI